jgi:hypothetical protein
MKGRQKFTGVHVVTIKVLFYFFFSPENLMQRHQPSKNLNSYSHRNNYRHTLKNLYDYIRSVADPDLKGPAAF